MSTRRSSGLWEIYSGIFSGCQCFWFNEHMAETHLWDISLAYVRLWWLRRADLILFIFLSKTTFSDHVSPYIRYIRKQKMLAWNDYEYSTRIPGIFICLSYKLMYSLNSVTLVNSDKLISLRKQKIIWAHWYLWSVNLIGCLITTLFYFPIRMWDKILWHEQHWVVFKQSNTLGRIASYSTYDWSRSDRLKTWKRSHENEMAIVSYKRLICIWK